MVGQGIADGLGFYAPFKNSRASHLKGSLVAARHHAPRELGLHEDAEDALSLHGAQVDGTAAVGHTALHHGLADLHADALREALEERPGQGRQHVEDGNQVFPRERRGRLEELGKSVLDLPHLIRGGRRRKLKRERGASMKSCFIS